MSQSVVRVHYTGSFDNGEIFDSSKEREPLEFIEGAHQVVPGFEHAVAKLQVGETVQVHIPCAEAYGEYDENLIQTIPLEHIPNAENLSLGETLYFKSPEGYPIPARILKIENHTAYFDFNSEMAGKDLNFEITLVSREQR